MLIGMVAHGEGVGAPKVEALSLHSATIRFTLNFFPEEIVMFIVDDVVGDLPREVYDRAVGGLGPWERVSSRVWVSWFGGSRITLIMLGPEELLVDPNG